MKKLIGSIAVLATASLSVTLAAPAQAAAPTRAQAGTTSLAQVLAADGTRFDSKWNDFDIVEKAVLTVLDAKPDSKVALVADPNTALTAFIPNDRAFRKLTFSLTGKRPAREAVVWKTLAGLVDVDTLETVLLYHVVPGAPITAAKALKADGAELTTAAGIGLTVRIKGHQVRLQDQDPDTRHAVVRIADINKGNKQIAHGINRVLRPVDL